MPETKINTTPVVKPAAPAFNADTKLYSFLEPSRRELDETKYSPEDYATIKGRMDSGMMMSDAVKGTNIAHALHTTLTNSGEAPTDVADDKYALNVNTADLKKSILDSNMSVDEKIKYERAAGLIDQMQANDLTIMRTKGGRYWLESNEDGKKHYATNSILEVAELMDKFIVDKEEPETTPEVTPKVTPEVTPDGEEEDATPTKKVGKTLGEIVDDGDTDEFTESEQWYLAALGTDLVSSIGGIIAKATGAGAPVGMGISIAGGVAALGMELRADYLDDEVNPWEMTKNALIRGGLEVLETVTVAPATLMNSLSKGSKALKVLKKSIHYGMTAGMISSAVGTNWVEILKKEDWDVDDYRKMAQMAQFAIGFSAGALGRKQSQKGIDGAVAKTKGGLKQAEADVMTANRSKYKKELEAHRGTEPVAKLKKEGVEKTLKARKSGVKKKKAINTNLKNNKKKIVARGDAEIKTTNKGANKPNIFVKPTVGKPAVKIEGPKTAKASKNTSKYTPAGKKLVEKSAANKKILNEVDSKIKKAKEKARTTKNKINKQVATEQKNIKITTKKELVKGEKELGKKLIAKKKAAGAEKHIKRQANLKDKKAVAVETHGKRRAEKMEAKAREKAGIEETASTTKKKAAAVRKVENKLKKYKNEKNRLEKKVAGNEKGLPTEAQKTEMKKISEKMEAATKELKSKKVKGKVLVEKSVNNVKKVTGNIAGRMESLGHYIITRDKASTSARTKSIIAGRPGDVGRADATKQLVAMGFDIKEVGKYSVKQLNEALDHIKKKGLKTPRKVDKKQDGGRLVAKYETTIGVQKAQIGFITPSKVEGVPASSEGHNPFDLWYDNIFKPSLDKLVGAGKFLHNRLEGQAADQLAIKAANTPAAPVKVSTDPLWEPSDNSVEKLVPYEWWNHLVPDIKPEEIEEYKAIIKEKPPVDDTIEPDPNADTTSTGDITNLEAKEAEEMQAAKDEAERLAIAEKYNRLRDLHKKVTETPGLFEKLSGAFGDLRLSDLMSSSKIHTVVPIQEEVLAPTLQSRGARNMPGLNAAINKTTLIPRVDTADSFAAGQMHKEFYNAGQNRRSELVAKNAAYVEQAKAEENNITNQNTQAAVAAENANIQTRNAAEASYAQQKAQADAAYASEENKRKGRLANAVLSGVKGLGDKSRKTKLVAKYNNVMDLNNIWNTEYAPKVAVALKTGKEQDVQSLKIDFMTKHNADPDTLQSQMLDYRAAYNS